METGSRSPTVFIVDDDPGVRKSLSVLANSVSLEAEAFGSAQEFLEALDPLRPGCLVLDLRLPAMSGLELQGLLAGQSCSLPIIFITGHGDVSTAVRAMQAGAVSFLEKPFRSQDLIDCIHRALELDIALRRAHTRRTQALQRLELLTRREHEVLDQIVAGKPPKVIACELKISRKTFDVHRGNIMRKLEVGTTAELVRMVLEARGGALEPGREKA
jgi:two-component system response regulator FixJ